jgi:acetyltransferase
MTYQIHHYPAELIDVVRLGDGERVVIRPVLPQDEDLTTAFFRSLSAPARYDRFMTSLRELPPELMRRFTQVDYADHLALVAEVFSGGRESVIAEARYVRRPNSLDAEFAVSVAEPWQAKMISLARKAGFTIQPSPEVRGLMLLEMALPGTQPCNDAEAAPLAA